MTSSIAKFANALPSANAAGESGPASSASRHSFGSSRAKPRLNTKAPAKIKTRHRKPADISRSISGEGSNAKESSSKMVIENAPAAFNDSFVRISIERSFRATDSACRSSLTRRPLECGDGTKARDHPTSQVCAPRRNAAGHFRSEPHAKQSPALREAGAWKE